MRGRAVHRVAPDQISSRAADDLAAGEAHRQPPVSVAVVGHAVRRHHRGHLRRAALRVKIIPPTVLAVHLGLRVGIRPSGF